MQQLPDRGVGTAQVAVYAYGGDNEQSRSDTIAVEEPMEIRIQSGADKQRRVRSICVTMRTPGQDFELALGFLHGEGLITHKNQVVGISFCGPAAPGKPQSNIIRVELSNEIELDLVKLQRNFYSTSSCGICGKASLDALNFEGYQQLTPTAPQVSAHVIDSLPDALGRNQPVFDQTGGLHAAGLFTQAGTLIASREDVGRHNAVDKVIGAQLFADNLPLSNHILVVSGRVSFEIMQKALAATIPIVVAVSAPSSLAVEMAQRFGITLIGFARNGRFNVYTGTSRITHLV